jgi:hypothetical protein
LKKPPRTAQKLETHVYIDATPSMKGFAAPGGAAQFGIFLRELDLALAQGGQSESDVRYYKFGTNINPIQHSPAFQAATSLTFYGGLGYLDTSIDRVLNEVNSKALTLIVTDLFQQDAEVSTLVAKVHAKVLPARLAFAVFGIKADFDGIIYDVGQQKLAFPYNSEGQKKRFRPFYLLAIGPPDEVSLLSEQLKRVSKTLDPSDVVILSPELLETPLDWEHVQIRDASGVNQNSGVINPPVSGGLTFKQVGQRDIYVRAALAYHAVPGTPEVNFSKGATVSVREVLWSSAGLFSGNGPRALNSEDAKVGINFMLSLEGGNLILDATIPRHKLPFRGTYVFEIKPVLRPESFQFPEFCSKWNMDLIETTHLTAKSSMDGTRTQNLRLLVDSVWSGMLQQWAPNPGTLYFYIER